MDVEHPAEPALHEFGGEQPHEAAETNQFNLVLVQRRLQHRLERRAIAPKACSRSTVGMPLASAFCKPPASARLEITTTISAGKSLASAAAISAAMFDPRPEIRMATRRFMVSPCQIEMTIIDHAMFALGGNHFAQKRHGFAALRENVGDLINRIRLDDGDHADAAVEGAQ